MTEAVPRISTRAPRRVSVDAGRVLAIVWVMIIHTVPFGHHGGAAVVGTRWDTATILNQLARWAVPCFFVLSGYFWSQRADTPARLWHTTRQTLRRLAMLLAVWDIVFILPYEGDRIIARFPHGFLETLARNWHWIITHPGLVLVQGTNGHLWFLAALWCCTAITALWLRWWPLGSLIVVAAALFVVTLLSEPYTKTPIGLSVPFNARNGPGFGLSCFVAGVLLQRRGLAAGAWRTGAALALGGIVLSVLELTMLHQRTGISLAQDFVAGTLPFGVGMAMLFLADPPALQWTRVASLGPMVLGLYALHPIFVDLLEPLAVRMASPGFDLGVLLAVFTTSLVTARLLARGSWTRPLVM